MANNVYNNLLSEVQGIIFPALPGVSAVTRLATLFQLEQSQWWCSQSILEKQLQQAQLLLSHAVQHTPYYQATCYRDFDFDNLSYDMWCSLPLITRKDIQSAGDKLKSKTIPVSHGKAFTQLTSGSTGKPIQTIATDISSFFWDVFTLRDHLWHKRDLTKKLAVIRYTDNPKAIYPNSLHSNNWGKATKNIYQTGDCYTLSIFTPIANQILWLQKIQPDYLLTHPSVLKQLALHCLEHDISLPFLHEVRTISEALPDDLRTLCTRAWNVPLIDLYSTIELGYIALQCPEKEHYHVQSENVLVEILDDKGHPCKPGQSGRVVISNLHNFAFPLIRYEIGDYAEAGDMCSCGRGLPVLSKIQGRYRNLATLPNGSKVWPKFNLTRMTELAPVLQFQAIQHTASEIEYMLVTDSPLTLTQTNNLINLFKSNLHPDLTIRITEVDSIPRSSSGKYEEFISLL